jgi:predicted nicotinamide N-methyase
MGRRDGLVSLRTGRCNAARGAAATVAAATARFLHARRAVTPPAVSTPTATVPEAKLDPVLRRFPLRRLKLPLGDSSLSLVVPDVGAWMRAGEWAANTVPNGEPPYWVQIWPASVAMARLLWRRGDLTGQRVLDLGCGLGVPGITACRAGAVVTFADVKPDALAFATWNGARQGSPVAPIARQVDWSQAEVPGPFDLMLLADVSYRPVHHAALKRHIRSCLAAGGVVLHADPVRRESTPFCAWLRDAMPAIEVRRPTAFLERKLDVRLVAASTSAAALAPWRSLLGEPRDVAHGPESPPPASAPAASPAQSVPSSAPNVPS